MSNSKYLTRTIDWRPLFNKDTLEKAKEIYNKGKYSDFRCDRTAARAQVGDIGIMGMHSVSIGGVPHSYSGEWKKSSFRCDCKSRRRIMYYYGSGETALCEHKAVVLMLWEKAHGPWEFTESQDEHDARIHQEEVEEETARRIKLKEKESKIPAAVDEIILKYKDGDELPYFNLEAILKNRESNKYLINRANDILDSAGVASPEISIKYDEKGTQILRCEATVDDFVSKQRTSLSISDKQIKGHRCSCFKGRSAAYNFMTGYVEDYYFCEHELALFAVLQRYINENNPGDATNEAASRLLESFGEQITRKNAEVTVEYEDRSRAVTLYPQILMEGHTPTLAFRIGRAGGKDYQLKNLRELVEYYDERMPYKLGKAVTLNFAKEDFDEASAKWMDYVRKKVADTDTINTRIRSRARWSYYATTINVSNKEALKGTMLDDFYDLTEGTQVPFKDKSKGIDGHIAVGHHSLNILLSGTEYRDSRGRCIGIDIVGQMPVIIEGGIDIYVLDERHLSRITSEEMDCISPLASGADSYGNIRLRIGMRNMPEFYYRILPELMNNPCVTYIDKCTDDMSDVLPPEAAFTFRLDRRDGLCVCSAGVSYGESRYELAGVKAYPQGEYRDLRQEDRVMGVLSKYFHYLPEVGYFAPDTDDEVFRILTEGVNELSAYGEVLGSKDFKTDAVRPVPMVSVGISVESDIMDLKILSDELSLKELLAVFDSYRLKKKYYRLDNGDYISFNNDEQLKELSELIDGLNLTAEEVIEKGATMPVYRALYLNKLLEEHDGLAADRDRAYRALIKNFNTIRDSDYDIPADMEKTLRPYQSYGYKWLRTLYEASFGGVLADEMGLGKTLQMIAVIKALKDEGMDRPSLIVSPASLIYNWQEEFRRFAPDIRTEVIAGGVGARKSVLSGMKKYKPAKSPLVYITSYDLLRKDIAHYEGVEFDLMCIDEAQFIKNQKAAMTKAVKGIKAARRFALTGTPIENRLAELWSIFDYLMPGFLYGYDEFQKRFELPITKNRDETATARLKTMVSPFILRRLKKDVLKDLPAKLEEVRYARFEDEQRKLYDAQVVHMKNMISDGTGSGKDKIQIFAELMRIRQICCDPSLVFEDYYGGSAKLDACIELIESAIEGGHRMLVFSQFTTMLEILERSLADRGIAYYKITGQTPKEKRLQMVHDFNEGGTPVFLISLKAGGTGLNLTGADVVIHYDPWWNLAVQNQATDRAHRIGQTKDVTVYKIIVKDTIEERIMRLQEAKRDLADAILSGEESSLFTLTGEELLELLEG